MASRIFQRRPGLRSEQLRVAGDHRLGDAIALARLGKRERANGAMYLAGFAVECWLKARLLDKYPMRRDAGRVEADRERRVANLLWTHDLDSMLRELPDIERGIRAGVDPLTASRLHAHLNHVAKWSVAARYSPILESTVTALVFVSRVEELRKWLR